MRWSVWFAFCGAMTMGCAGIVEATPTPVVEAPRGSSDVLHEDGSHTKTHWDTVAAGTWTLAASCRPEEHLVAGRCDADAAGGNFLRVTEDAPAGTGWACAFTNESPSGASGRIAVEVHCAR